MRPRKEGFWSPVYAVEDAFEKWVCGAGARKARRSSHATMAQYASQISSCDKAGVAR